MPEDISPEISEAVGEGQTEPASPQNEELNAKLEELQQELADANNSMLRALADLQNYRRRANQDVERARSAALGEIVAHLLPLLDNFERTLSAADEGASRESLLEGVKIIEGQLRSVLAKFKLQKIQAVGSTFDPNLHEAIVAERSDSPQGAILEEIEPGYMLGSTVLRPSKVKVSKGPGE